MYWLIFYNLKNGSKILKSFLISLSIIYSLIYLSSIIFNINLIKLAELFFEQSTPIKHWDIGDLWAFTLVALIGLEWNNFKFKNWLITGSGLIFLVLSNARSAYLSLALGLGYIVAKKTGSSKLKKTIIISLISIIAGLFIFSSFGKTTLFDRPYYFQSIESFAKHPLGIGMGNFKQIATEYRLKDPNNISFSIYTHNIFLEALSGVGIFSILFLIFLIYVARDILKENAGGIAWGAVLIAILINFMFDTSYTIPGLVWILFMSLGVFHSKQRSLYGS